MQQRAGQPEESWCKITKSLDLWLTETVISVITFCYRPRVVARAYLSTTRLTFLSLLQVSFFMLTVYVEDINDNKPVFMNAPYSVTIDETTPFGSIVFQDIQAVDRDQPNTPNSDIQYFIGTQTVSVLLYFIKNIYLFTVMYWKIIFWKLC